MRRRFGDRINFPFRREGGVSNLEWRSFENVIRHPNMGKTSDNHPDSLYILFHHPLASLMESTFQVRRAF